MGEWRYSSTSALNHNDTHYVKHCAYIKLNGSGRSLLSRHFLRDTEENHEKILIELAGVQAQIRIGHLPKISQESPVRHAILYMQHVVVKALRYKPEGRGFETRCGECIFFFNLPNPSGRTRPWGLLSL
jgi:hypothetical protein